MFIFLSTSALVLGFLSLYASTVPKIPTWLRIANILVGASFAGLGVWSVFFTDDTMKVFFPTPLYIIPILGVIFSSLYQWNIITWGLNYAEKPIRMKKVREPKAPKPVKVKAVKVKKEKPLKVAQVEEVPAVPAVVEAQVIPPVTKPVSLPQRPVAAPPAKPTQTPKSVTTSDGFDLKLPDLF